MSKCTKGKIRLNNYHYSHKYLVFDEGNNDNDAFPGQRRICDIWDWHTPKGEANAKELVRRWNAFEEGGLVEELRTACKEALSLVESDYRGHSDWVGPGVTLGPKLEAALAKS